MTNIEKIIIAPLVADYKHYLANRRARLHNVELSEEELRMNDSNDHINFILDFEVIRMLALEAQTEIVASSCRQLQMVHPAFKNATIEQINILLNAKL